MAFAVRVLADSLSPTGDRLTTIVATYPRPIHSELMTHRVLSRNSASSRAIPVEKLLKMIEEDPFVPIWWGKAQGGMQAHEEIEDKAAAEAWWREGLAAQIAHARRGLALNLHKQIVNRVVESGMWITVIISSTTWSNFKGLRVHPDAEPHFQRFAGMAMEAIAASTPAELPAGEWHLPLVHEEDWGAAANMCGYDSLASMEAHNGRSEVQALLIKVAVGRCARVSYLTHEGKRDLQEDIKLHDRLMVQEPLHASPGEHVAQAMDWPAWFARGWPTLAAQSSRALNEVRMINRVGCAAGDTLSPHGMAVEAALAQIQSGNFRGFRQYRKLQANEHIGEPMP